MSSYMSSYMNYSELQALDNSYSELSIGTIPSLHSINVNETNTHVQPFIEIKESILDIINKQAEITIEDEDFENTDVKSILAQLQTLTPSFEKLQDELSEIDKQYKDEIKEIKKKISTIDSMIAFIKQISYSSIEKKDLEEMIEKMKTISEGIVKNEVISKLRDSYIQKRKELHPHLALMKQLNQWNVANMCPICFKSQVTHFLNPCGHTGCKECLERNKREMSTINNLPQSNSTFECAFCRKQISSIKPLFFL